MPFRLFWRFTGDTATITASSTATGYSAENLKRNTLSTKWKSAAFGSDLSESLTFNLGAPSGISAVAILGHDFLGTESLLLKHADDAAFSVNVGTIVLTPRADGAPITHFFTEVVKQYWRVVIDLGGLSPGPTETREIARILLGPHFTMTRNLRLGYQLGLGKDTSKSVRTIGGQLYGDLGVRLKTMSGEFTALPQTDTDEIETLKETYGTTIPFLASMDWEGDPVKKTLYGTLDKIDDPKNIAGNKWTHSWAMTEQK